VGVVATPSTRSAGRESVDNVFALGAVAALWAVAGLAVVGGQSLLRFVNIRTVRLVTAVVLVGLAGFAAWEALR